MRSAASREALRPAVRGSGEPLCALFARATRIRASASDGGVTSDSPTATISEITAPATAAAGAPTAVQSVATIVVGTIFWLIRKTFRRSRTRLSCRQARRFRCSAATMIPSSSGAKPPAAASASAHAKSAGMSALHLGASNAASAATAATTMRATTIRRPSGPRLSTISSQTSWLKALAAEKSTACPSASSAERMPASAKSRDDAGKPGDAIGQVRQCADREIPGLASGKKIGEHKSEDDKKRGEKHTPCHRCGRSAPRFRRQARASHDAEETAAPSAARRTGSIDLVPTRLCQPGRLATSAEAVSAQHASDRQVRLHDEAGGHDCGEREHEILDRLRPAERAHAARKRCNRHQCRYAIESVLIEIPKMLARSAAVICRTPISRRKEAENATPPRQSGPTSRRSGSPRNPPAYRRRARVARARGKRRG